jgi:hypothetical protein
MDTSVIQSIYIKLEFMRVYIQGYYTLFTTTATGPHGISAHRRFWSAPHSPSSKINNNNEYGYGIILIIIIIIQRIKSRNLSVVNDVQSIF